MRANVGVIVGRDVRRPGHALLWDLMGGGVVARNDFKPLAWNQALMKAYVDTAMGAHEATDEDVDRSVYYEASDIEMSAGDIDELCENESAEPGTLRAYEGVKRATELTEEAGTIDISRSRNDHRRALLRLIDIANASGDLLEDENENGAEEATIADTHGNEIEREEPNEDTAIAESDNPDFESDTARDLERDVPDAESPSMEKETRTDEEEDMREEIKILRELLAAEIRKEARHRNTIQ
jgi:hypothetical protein